MIAGLPEDLQKTFGEKDELLIHELIKPIEPYDLMTDTKQKGSLFKKSPKAKATKKIKQFTKIWNEKYPRESFPNMHPLCVADVMLSHHFKREDILDGKFKETLEKNIYTQLAVLLIRAKRRGCDLDTVICSQLSEESLIKTLSFHGTSFEKALGIISKGASKSKRNKFEGKGDEFYSTGIVADVNFLSRGGYAYQASSDEQDNLVSTPTLYVIGTIEGAESTYVPVTEVDSTTPKGHTISKEGALLLPVMMIKLRSSFKHRDDDQLLQLNQYGKLTLDHFETAYKAVLNPQYHNSKSTNKVIRWINENKLRGLARFLWKQEPDITKSILNTLESLHLSPEEKEALLTVQRNLEESSTDENILRRPTPPPKP